MTVDPRYPISRKNVTLHDPFAEPNTNTVLANVSFTRNMAVLSFHSGPSVYALSVEKADLVSLAHAILEVNHMDSVVDQLHRQQRP